MSVTKLFARREWTCSECKMEHCMSDLGALDDDCLNSAIDEFEDPEFKNKMWLHPAYAFLMNEKERRPDGKG